MSEKESALPGAKTIEEPQGEDSKNFGNHKLNQNVVRTLQAAAEGCQRSSIGAVFENIDLRLTNIPDPLAGLRKLATLRESRLTRFGESMTDKQREILTDELFSIQEAINILDDQKYEIWGLIYSYLKQLPKGLGSAIITLPLSMSGKGIATIDLMTRKAVVCIYEEDTK